MARPQSPVGVTGRTARFAAAAMASSGKVAQHFSHSALTEADVGAALAAVTNKKASAARSSENFSRQAKQRGRRAEMFARQNCTASRSSGSPSRRGSSASVRYDLSPWVSSALKRAISLRRWCLLFIARPIEATATATDQRGSRHGFGGSSARTRHAEERERRRPSARSRDRYASHRTARTCRDQGGSRSSGSRSGGAMFWSQAWMAFWSQAFWSHPQR